jgi:hypothetical protein
MTSAGISPLVALPGRTASRAPRPLERIAEPTMGQPIVPPAARGSRHRRLEREDGAHRFLCSRPRRQGYQEATERTWLAQRACTHPNRQQKIA